ncbi:hypothetical protein [Celerinatantimonas sp. YJH-8]|uniref:RipA family octameric membrane protein n=1 Tax=Celerinatantimonas sp. YJH-8 TaxID=3228714 RepID=UPI0038C64D89
MADIFDLYKTTLETSKFETELREKRFTDAVKFNLTVVFGLVALTSYIMDMEPKKHDFFIGGVCLIMLLSVFGLFISLKWKAQIISLGKWQRHWNERIIEIENSDAFKTCVSGAISVWAHGHSSTRIKSSFSELDNKSTGESTSGNFHVSIALAFLSLYCIFFCGGIILILYMKA